MYTTKILYGLLAIAISNAALFLYFLVFSDHGWYLVRFPHAVIEIVLCYIPILLTAASLGVFFFEFVKSKRWNWFCLFIVTFAYSPIVIWSVSSLFGLLTGHEEN